MRKSSFSEEQIAMALRQAVMELLGGQVNLVSGTIGFRGLASLASGDITDHTRPVPPPKYRLFGCSGGCDSELFSIRRHRNDHWLRCGRGDTSIFANSRMKRGEQGLASTGLPYVIIIGTIVVRDSKVLKDIYPGKPVRNPIRNYKGRPIFINKDKRHEEAELVALGLRKTARSA